MRNIQIAVLFFLIWISALACQNDGGVWDPDGVFRSEYRWWGQQLHQHRDDGFAWKDGSGWTDGVSNIPPELPLATGSLLNESFTCAQEETLVMMAFPRNEEPDEWHLQSNAEEINRRWYAEFSRMVWGDDADNREWLVREPFAKRCGFGSDYRLFYP